MPVLLGGENGALPIVRSLARSGLTSVIVASERPDDPTFHSRYCVKRLVLERFDATTDRRNVDALVRLSQSLDETPVLYWGSDREILFINRNRDVLGRWYRFVLPDPVLTENLVDKGKFALLAHSSGMPVPETMIFSSITEILRQQDSIPFPCTIKPVYMCHWYSDSIKKRFGTYKHILRRLTGPEELEEYVRLLPNIDKGVVVQRFIEGSDEQLISFHGYFDFDGQPVACFVGRKIRTNPIHFGGSAYIETIHEPDFMAFCVDVCTRIGFKGIVKIDCKRDASTGQYYILEFNPRFNLWEYLGATAGVNIPRIWYDNLCTNHCQPTFSYEEGRRWLYLSADLRAILDYIEAGEWTVWSWIKSYFAPKVYHTFDWRDPWPLLFTFPRFLRRKLARWRLKDSGEGTAIHTMELPEVAHDSSGLRA